MTKNNKSSRHNNGSNLSYLTDYSPFESTSQLNAAVDDHIRRNSRDLNGTDHDILMMLAQYSVLFER